MSYIGNVPTNVAFLTDQFNGNGSLTAFTLSAAPANTNSILVAVSGVLQDPTTYSVSGTTLTFSAAPPVGTGNISVRFLGIPASGVTTTAYRTVTEFTATAGQTTFTPPSYTVGYINVYRNGALLGTADYTATNGTTVVLTNAASLGDLVVVESFLVSSVLNAIPNGVKSVNTSNLPVGTVLQVVQAITQSTTSTTSTSYVTTSVSGSITPNATSNKILVQVYLGTSYASSGGVTGTVTIYRNASTDLAATTQGFALSSSVGNLPVSFAYLDSPSSTSSTTYTVYMKTNSGTFYVGGTNSGVAVSNSITLTEIAA